MPQFKLSKWSSIAHSCHNTALALKLPRREKTWPWSTEMTQSLGRAWWDWWCPLLFLKQGMGLPESLVVFFPLHILASFVEDKVCIGCGFISGLSSLFHWSILLSLCSRVPSGKESACHAGDACLIPGLGISPGEANGNPLQYSCLRNSMDWGAWWVIVHEVANESDIS